MLTTDSHRMRLARLAAIPAVLAMVGARPASAECTKDAECKGARICESGRCVYPSSKVERQGPSDAASPEAAPLSATPAPGSPPSLVPPAGAPAVATPPTGTIAEPSVSAPVAAGIAPPREGAAPGSIRVPAGAAPAEKPRRTSEVEIGAFGFAISDGDSGAFGGGVQAGFKFSRLFGIGLWLEGSGPRDAMEGEVAYRLYDVGLGLTTGAAVRSGFAELSVGPELTRIAFKGEFITPIAKKAVSWWGAAAAARLRLGLQLGSWRPFILAAVSFPLGPTERPTVYHQHVYSGSATLPRIDVITGLGLAYCFGAASAD